LSERERGYVSLYLILNYNQISFFFFCQSGIFSRGIYTAGKELVDEALESIRKMAEACDSLDGVMLYKATGSGTGLVMLKIEWQ
jgi:hypothetical protein